MIREIPVAEIFAAPNVKELFSEYAVECSIPLIGEINPQPEIYAAIERAGIMQCFGAYEDDLLVGFATVLMMVLPHYGKKTATVESIFIAHEHRAGGIGRSLLKSIEGFAKGAGCVAILYSTPAGGTFERLLSLSGYAHTNAVFCRSLL